MWLNCRLCFKKGKHDFWGPRGFVLKVLTQPTHAITSVIVVWSDQFKFSAGIKITYIHNYPDIIAHRFDTVIKIPYSLAYLFAAFDLFFHCYGWSVRIGSWRLGICKNQYYLSLPKSTIFITRKTAKIIEDVCLLSVGSYVWVISPW